MRKKCLFLGYSIKETNIIKLIKEKGWSVKQWGNKKPHNIFLKYDLIISYGYRHIINKSLLNKLKRPAINLHLSYLPHNRGAHPNFWSFIKNTYKGVTLHEIDDKVDRGKLIYRKKINFRKTINSFEKTYFTLRNSIEKLFAENIDDILDYTYKTKKFERHGSFHRKSDLPEFMVDWKIGIKKAKKLYKNNYKIKKYPS